MNIDLFDFALPPERIALRPVRPRDAAKMLVVRGEGAFEDRGVRDLPDLLRAGDVLVFNDTRVIPRSSRGVGARRQSARRCTSGSICAAGRPLSATPSGSGKAIFSPSAAG